MADEIRELMNKKDEIEKEIKEYFDVLQAVGLMVSICYDFFSGDHNIAHCEPTLIRVFFCIVTRSLARVLKGFG